MSSTIGSIVGIDRYKYLTNCILDPLRKRHIQTLQGNNLVVDRIVDYVSYYMQTCVAGIGLPIFLRCDDVILLLRNETRPYLIQLGRTIVEGQIVFLPLLHSSHYVLFTAQLIDNERVITIYDPSRASIIATHIIDKLIEQINIVLLCNWCTLPSHVVTSTSHPYQPWNSMDCAIYIINYMRGILLTGGTYDHNSSWWLDRDKIAHILVYATSCNPNRNVCIDDAIREVVGTYHNNPYIDVRLMRDAAGRFIHDDYHSIRVAMMYRIETTQLDLQRQEVQTIVDVYGNIYNTIYILGDGDCLYTTLDTSRRAVYRYMKQIRDVEWFTKLYSFIEPYITINEYMRRLRIGDMWGSVLEVILISIIIERNICIVSRSGETRDVRLLMEQCGVPYAVMPRCNEYEVIGYVNYNNPAKAENFNHYVILTYDRYTVSFRELRRRRLYRTDCVKYRNIQYADITGTSSVRCDCGARRMRISVDCFVCGFVSIGYMCPDNHYESEMHMYVLDSAR